MVEQLGVSVPVLIDEMDNPIWCTYDPAPNIVYFIGKDGMIIEKQGWYEPELMKEEIHDYLFGVDDGQYDEEADYPEDESSDDETYDLEVNGYSRFVNVNYIHLMAIDVISKFRSGVGHDYSDSFETCRSMKHYFGCRRNVDPSTVEVVSPVGGYISNVFGEYMIDDDEKIWEGIQIWVTSDEYPAFTFRIFHVELAADWAVGDEVSAGDLFGVRFGPGPGGMSDIAVMVKTPQGERKVSYFDLMTDTLFEKYKARGVQSRQEMIFTEEERDADPLNCVDKGSFFLDGGNLENWVNLN